MGLLAEITMGDNGLFIYDELWPGYGGQRSWGYVTRSADDQVHMKYPGASNPYSGRIEGDLLLVQMADIENMGCCLLWRFARTGP